MLLHRQANPLIAARRNDPGVSLGSLFEEFAGGNVDFSVERLTHWHIGNVA